MIYCFDLDDTLCYPNHEAYLSETKYGIGYCRPNQQMIDYLNGLYDDGHKIIIHTARRMLTHKDNVQHVILDVGKITTDWLKFNNVKYHEIIFGKPYADFYIDDKSLNFKELMAD